MIKEKLFTLFFFRMGKERFFGFFFNRPREKEVMDGENIGWRKVLDGKGSRAWVGKEGCQRPQEKVQFHLTMGQVWGI